MATTQFPRRPRRDDPNGHMVVWDMLGWLRDAFDKFVGKFDHGTATIAQAATTVLVSHNLGVPLYYAVASPQVDPNARWWVSNKTSTQFQLNLSAAAGVGGVPFDWLVKAA